MARISPNQLKIEFKMEFSEQLDPNNELVQLAHLINWELADKLYYPTVSQSIKNTNSKESRMAFGALILQQRYNFTDRMLISMIEMNPYFQYFIGLDGFQRECPFSQSTLVQFRKRITLDMVMEINEEICNPDNDDHTPNSESQKRSDKGTPERQLESDTPKNKGKLILDATCAPQDIKYPTDWDLLNKSREMTEAIIDDMHQPMIGKAKKPRTYRDKARQSFLNLSKSKRKSKSKIRKTIRFQLECIRRNLNSIKRMRDLTGYNALSSKQHWDLMVIHEVYRQQRYMYSQNTRSIEERIVSLHSPHIRPIVRGKAKAPVEFGAKLAISVVSGYTYLERLSWDAYNEGKTLIDSVESYKERFGYYPQQVLADKLYRTRENLTYLNKRKIKILGPKLGRPKKGEVIDRKAERIAEGERNIVESKFGQGKRKYGLDLIMTRLKDTSETVIGLTFLVMNLERRLRLSFTQFLDSLKFVIKGLFRPNNLTLSAA